MSVGEVLSEYPIVLGSEDDLDRFLCLYALIPSRIRAGGDQSTATSSTIFLLFNLSFYPQDLTWIE